MSRNRIVTNPHRLWIGVIALAACSVPAMATNMVTNGSFETLTGTPLETSSFKVDDPSTDTLSAWTTTPGTPAATNILTCLVMPAGTNGPSSKLCGTLPASPNLGNNLSLWAQPGVPTGFTQALAGESPDGGNYILADGDATYSAPISENITGLVNNQEYQLSFWQAAGQENGFGTAGQSQTDTWDITLGGQTITPASMTNAYKGKVDWNQQTITFKYTGASGTGILSFLATSTAPSGNPPFLMLDGVSLVPAPEPGTWSCLLLAGLTIVLARKRFRKQA